MGTEFGVDVVCPADTDTVTREGKTGLATEEGGTVGASRSTMSLGGDETRIRFWYPGSCPQFAGVTKVSSRQGRAARKFARYRAFRLSYQECQFGANHFR